jgi:hypothetical protein
MIELGYAPRVRYNPVPLYMRGYDFLGQDGTDIIPIDTTNIDVGSELTPPTFADFPDLPNALLVPSSAGDVSYSSLPNVLSEPSVANLPQIPNAVAAGPTIAAGAAQAAAAGVKAVTSTIAPSPRITTRVPGQPAPSAITGSTVIPGLNVAVPNLALIGGGLLLLLAAAKR